MIKLYCDFCGGEIIDPDDQTCLSFKSYMVSGGPMKEYQLHANCAKMLKKKLESMMRLKPEKGEDNGKQN